MNFRTMVCLSLDPIKSQVLEGQHFRYLADLIKKIEMKELLDVSQAQIRILHDMQRLEDNWHQSNGRNYKEHRKLFFELKSMK